MNFRKEEDARVKSKDSNRGGRAEGRGERLPGDIYREALCSRESLEKEDSSDQQRWRSKAASHRASRGCL